VVAAKLYPAGATTNSDAGVTDMRKTYKTLEAMQKAGMLLLVHGEVTSSDIDLFDREAVFIDTQLIPLRKDFPELKIVFEHITTAEAAHYVRLCRQAHRARPSPRTTCCTTATPSSPAAFVRITTACPCLKRETHRLALVQSSHQWLMPNSSWAPTVRTTPRAASKNTPQAARVATPHTPPCPCMPKRLTNAQALGKLEGIRQLQRRRLLRFAAQSPATLTLRTRKLDTARQLCTFGEAELKPLRAGEALPWRVV
jgi:dihydroorotase